MSAIALRMPPQIASTATLATQLVDPIIPNWAASRSTVTLAHDGEPDHVAGRRSERDIYRLPNSSQAVRNWLYTRPDVEAVDEQAFESCAIESSTIFRIHGFNVQDNSIHISPTVSNHWLLVPVQSINGVTVGLAYLDVLYKRKEPQHCVPPLSVGKFAIEDTTGEIFMTGWTGAIMVVAWTQSIVKCERVREYLMYHAPPLNGKRPRHLLLRNSFYERRDCHLCGMGNGLNNLSPPCSSTSSCITHDSTTRRSLTKVATLYRRFRGAYFGVCLKTAYDNGVVKERVLVPIFIDVRHGLNAVKESFRLNVQRNSDVSLNRLFGLHPTSSSRVFFLRTAAPVSSFPMITDGHLLGKRKAPLDSCPTSSGSSSINRFLSTSPTSIFDQETSAVSSEGSKSPPSRRRRRVGVDEVNRESIEFERKQRNRIAAERSNRVRKAKLERERKELLFLKEKREQLRTKQMELSLENSRLRRQIEASKSDYNQVCMTGT